MRKIGIFDSGVGGVSVLKEILEVLPFHNIVYFGDNLNAPYGDREIEEIRSLCLKVSDFLVYKEKIDVLVIACNTATAASLNLMKEKYSIPIIGVVENGIKDGLKMSKNKKIGVLATPATIKMDVYRKSGISLDSSAVIYGVGCSLLAGKIEKGWVDSIENDNLVKEYLDLLPRTIDTLILGCTHYPFIKKNIEKYFKGTIVDPAVETAQFLKNEIGVGELFQKPFLKFYTSGDTEGFRKIAQDFLEKE
ncbi:MAG: glutamate racemase, partial [Fusobacteriaceae bacterium]